MARWKPTRCRVCGSSSKPVSTRALCAECAIDRQTAAAMELHDREGPRYERWRERMIELMPSKRDRF